MSMGIFSTPAKIAKPLGADNSGAWSWKNQTPNASVKAFQTWLNTQLKPRGYYPIDADGKLGPATCGAALHLLNYHGDVDWSGAAAQTYLDNYGLCQAWTYPTKVGNSKPETNTLVQATSQDQAALPWATFSEKTVAAQNQVNAQLVGQDYLPIGVDGKMGSLMCGAMRELDQKTGSSFLFNYGKDCQSFTAPTKKAAPVLPATPTAPTGPTGPIAPIPSGPVEPSVVASTSKKMSTASMVTGIAVVGGVAALGYWYAKKQGLLA